MKLPPRLEELQTAEALVREGLTPMPYRIRFYLDSFRVQLVARELGERSRKVIESAVETSRSTDAGVVKAHLDFEVTPDKLAELMASTLWSAERLISREMERQLLSLGHKVVTGSALQSAALALWRPIFSGKLEVNGDSFLDVKSDGVIFAPTPIDTDLELARLNRFANALSPSLVHANTMALAEGKIVKRSGSVLDLAFSQSFVDSLATQIGRASREGHYRIHWSEYLEVKEKGVDADLIINAYDDLMTGQVDTFVFLTNDSDFAPLMRRIRDEGKVVVLCGTPMNLSKDLLRATGGPSAFIDLTEFSVGDDIWLKSDDWDVRESFNYVVSEWKMHQTPDVEC